MSSCTLLIRSVENSDLPVLPSCKRSCPVGLNLKENCFLDQLKEPLIFQLNFLAICTTKKTHSRGLFDLWRSEQLIVEKKASYPMAATSVKATGSFSKVQPMCTKRMFKWKFSQSDPPGPQTKDENIIPGIRPRLRSGAQSWLAKFSLNRANSQWQISTIFQSSVIIILRRGGGGRGGGNKLCK